MSELGIFCFFLTVRRISVSVIFPGFRRPDPTLSKCSPGYMLSPRLAASVWKSPNIMGADAPA